MNKIAIDVVLLPPADVTARAIEISQKLFETSGNAKVVLDGKQYLPHISLCMGAVHEEDLQVVNALLNDIAKSQAVLDLTISGIRAHTLPTGEQLSVLEVTNQPSLQNLHETIMHNMQPYLSYDDVDTSMFFGPPEAEPISVKFVRDFDQSKPDVMPFYPHLTSGFGTYNAFDFPINFTADTLAICHLGNYCTCRKALASFELHK